MPNVQKNESLRELDSLFHDMVLHKCTASFKLVHSLQELIASARADRTYPKWSDDFLAFCERIANGTSEWLKQWSKINVEDGLPVSVFSSVILGWELLHSFIKPVLDADNLKVPYPLVHFLTDHVGKLEKVKDAKFVIEISPDLNYFQHQHTDLRRAMVFLQTVVGVPLIEPIRGFLALPCSQSKGLFMNCLLYHETGHFIAEETGLISPTERAKLSDELKKEFQKQHNADVPLKQYLPWAVTTIEDLMEELFSDLVAVKLIGLAYTISYMELLRLVRKDLSQESMRFSINHPADAIRFREQLKVLKKDGWAKYAKNLTQWKELNRIARVREKQYSIPSEYQSDPKMSKVWNILIKCLCKRSRINSIHIKVNSCVADRENPCELYRDYGEGIKKCLSHAIVPCSQKSSNIPHPLAVINGAVLFWLSDMTDLYHTVPDRSEKKIEDRVFLENRVEMWCLKAIENWLIKMEQQIKKHQVS